MHTKPIHGCFNNLGGGGVNRGDFPREHDSWVHELANDLRLGTAVPSQDLSAAWVTVRGRELVRASASP
jgi:hypothetical protein